MLNNAHSANINGGNFTVIGGNLNNGLGALTGLDTLREQSALGALLDSNERFDPPRCAEHTRVAILQDMMDWILGGKPDGASMMWLYGAAGAGKSALAQEIAELCQKKGLHAASFFFSRTASVERSTGNRLIPTLVFQLLQAFPQMRPNIEKAIKDDSALFMRSRKTQMDKLLVEPLQALSSIVTKHHRRRPSVQRYFSKLFHVGDSAKSKARLIVIDGLDECQDPEVQKDLLRLIAAAIPRISLPLRFLVASRPESHITHTINYDLALPASDLRSIDLGNDPDRANDDIRTFIHQEFDKIRRSHPLRHHLPPLEKWPTQQAIDNLVQKSSTQFIYAATAMKYICHARGLPERRLEIILGLPTTPAPDKPLAQLDALYIFILRTIDPSDQETITRLFGVLCIANQENTKAWVRRPSVEHLEEVFGMSKGQLTILLDPLLSIVSIPASREDQIKIYHASLFDFLLDSSRSGDLCLDLSLAHETLAIYWMKGMYHDVISWELDPSRVDPLLVCTTFLDHCRYSPLSEPLKAYLQGFPYLYQVACNFIMDLPDHMDTISRSDRNPDIFKALKILHRLFAVLSRKEFGEDRIRLISWHATQLKLIFDPPPLNIDKNAESPGPVILFKNRIYQCQHEVYAALPIEYLRFDNLAELAKLDFLDRILDTTSFDLRLERWSVIKHGLILTLGPKAQKSLHSGPFEVTRLMNRWAENYMPGDELDEMVIQTVKEHLERCRREDPDSVGETESKYEAYFRNLFSKTSQ